MKRVQAFAPRKAAYKIYLEIFENKQVADMPKDLFITKKRSLLSQIEQPLEEAVQLDMVFGLLRAEIREKMSRNIITTFEELLIGARKVEDDLAEKIHAAPAPPSGPKKLRCEFCRTAWPNVGRKKEAAGPRSSLSKGRLLQPPLHGHSDATAAKGQGSCTTCNPSTSADRPVGRILQLKPNHPRHGRALKWPSAQKEYGEQRSLTSGRESASPFQDSGIISALPVQPLLKFH